MKKTKFDKNVQNITFKPDTCLNSGEIVVFLFSKRTDTFKQIVSYIFLDDVLPILFPDNSGN